MTLRDLIKECRYKPVFNILYKECYKGESLSKIQSIDFLCLNIWNNLISKGFEANKDIGIRISNRIKNLIGKRRDIDVYFHSNISNEEISFDSISWGELADVDIEVIYERSYNDDSEFKKDTILAHILREIISRWHPEILP